MDKKLEKFTQSESSKAYKSVDEIEYMIISKSAEYVGDLDRE
jgi:hypothetical protein